MIEIMTEKEYEEEKGIEVIEQREVFGQDFKIYGDKENPLFLAKDVAEWIGNKNVTEMVSKVDEEEVTRLNLGGKQGICNFLTEDGLYEVLMQSRKPIAKAFKKEVKKILKEIRLTGKFDGALPKSPEEIMIWQLKEQQKIKQQLNEVNHHMLRTTNEVEKLEEDFRVYKDEDTLRVVECEEISDLVKKTGVRVLGGKGSKAYKDKGLRMKVFKNIWAEVRNQFDVNKYKQIKRKHFEKAKEIVRDYKITFALEEEIKITNNQFSF